ncbi:MAG: hypothetical protein HYX42_07285 [Polaromonas sp.]|uniref:hypothetical protein n=1 Tax=Polaromonas sp. TaxID=1869339 RepID=UPI0025CB9F6C|nr:hypothetical protein [Polaromonas sp.]MBI2726038.1 hypothetical protein [Polaromonas sp.]
MNRCTHVFLACLLAAMGMAPLTPPALAQTGETVKPNIRQFPKLARRGELVIVTPPDVALDGKADRLSPGIRIRDANNNLVLSGTLVNVKLPVRYLRDNTGLLQQIWVLNAEEARQKMPGEDGGGILNNIRSMFETTPASDDGNTPYDKLPPYK